MADAVPPPAPAPAPQPAPAPAKKGNRTLLIVLAVLGGIFLLMGGCVATCAYIGYKKAKEVTEASQSNPAYAALSIMAAFHPDLEVVSKDPATGVMVLKHKKTGEVSTVDTTQYTEENIEKLIQSLAEGKGAPAPKGPPKVTFTAPSTTATASAPPDDWPDYVTLYGGATGVKTSTAKNDGMLDFSFNYSGATDDAPDAVLEYYAQEFESAGFTVRRDPAGKNTFGPTGSLTALRKDPYAEVHVKAETTYDNRTSLLINGGEKK